MGASIKIQSSISYNVEPDEQPDERNESRKKIAELLESAFTCDELDAARRLYEAHLLQWPEDRKRDMAHRLPRAFDYQKQRAAEAARLGLTEAETAHREVILRPCLPDYDDAIGAQAALSSIAARRTELEEWLSRFPDDQHVRNAHISLEMDKQTALLIAGTVTHN